MRSFTSASFVYVTYSRLYDFVYISYLTPMILSLYYLLLYSKISVDQPLKFFREYLFSSFQATLLKRDSSASVFQWIVRNFLRKPIFWNTYEWLPLYIVRLIQPGEKFACTRFITHLIQLYRKYKNKKILLICSQIQNKVRYGF